jgi:hypothetical protein
MPHWLGWMRMMKKFGNYNMQHYVFESKRDLLYHNNYLALNEALEQAGVMVLLLSASVSELLDTLARNNIELSAKYLDVPEKSV